jgi:hypothetical protein
VPPKRAAKKLTANEKSVISKKASKAVKFYSGKKITADQKAGILAAATAYKNQPKSTFGKEAIALWAAKVEYAIATGDKPKAKTLTRAPIGPEAARRSPQDAELYDSNGN